MKKLFYTFLICNICLPIYSFSQSPGGLNPVTVGLGFWSKANSQQAGKVVLNGSTVSNWVDENSTYSTNQPVATQQPTYVTVNPATGNFNFNPFLDFDLTASKCLTNNTTISNLNSNNMTAFLVSNINSVGKGSTLGYTNGTNKIQIKSYWRVQNGIAGNGTVANLYTAPPNNFYTPIFGDSAARIIVMHGMGASFNARVNTITFPVVLNSGTYNPAVIAGLHIGYNGTTEYVNDDIAEIIIYNTKLSLTDVNKVETYLAIKYGNTFLTNQNYTLANNTIVWDAVADAGYYHNITGIGREDASGLYQKQSKSVNYKELIEMYNNTVSTFPSTNDSNTTTFANDNAIMVFGDNDSTTNLIDCSDNNYKARMARVWKVHTTPSFTGATTLKLESTLVPNIKSLLISTTPNFTAGTTTVVPLSTSGTSLYASFTFTDNTYFSFASDSIQNKIVVTPATCAGANGIANATTSNGVSPYTYTWSSPIASTTNIANNLSAGNYTLSIGHGFNNACVIKQAFTIKDSSILKHKTTITNPLCFGGFGSFKDSIIVGTAPFVFTLNTGATNNTGSFTNLIANTYTLNIKDNAGCSLDSIFTLIQPQDITYDTLITPTCWNENTGTLAIPTLGGISPYTYSFDNQNNILYSTFNNLQSGSHKIIIKDANGCSKKFTITIPTLDAFKIQSTELPSHCLDLNSSSILLTLTNGNPPFYYNWINQSNSTNYLNNIAAGTYTVQIADIFGCKETHTYTTINDCCFAWFPNAVSCNNDGYYDTFIPQLSYTMVDVDFRIVNRFGQVVFSTTDKTKGWDGKVNGVPADIGTYYYLLKANCNGRSQVFKGDFIIIR